VILSELGFGEDHASYRSLQISNNGRQYDFLNSAIETALAIKRPFLSSSLIKALNFHAIACLHPTAGEYRQCSVEVGKHKPVDHWRVATQMEDFVNGANYNWKEVDPVNLAAWTLWRLNYIHPFINGNGRTARAVCYFVLCVKAGGLLPGYPILPELLVRERPRYCAALAAVDDSMKATFDLTPIHSMVAELLVEQLQVNTATNQNAPALPPPDANP
jgi:prophage maintenance system killer protein